MYKSIEDIPWSGKLTGGNLKGNGVFIHDDGTGGYYMEFDWGDEEEKTKTKSKNPHVLYSDSYEIQNLNISAYDELDHAGFKTDVLLSLVGIKMRRAGKYVGETSELFFL